VTKLTKISLTLSNDSLFKKMNLNMKKCYETCITDHENFHKLVQASQ